MTIVEKIRYTHVHSTFKNSKLKISLQNKFGNSFFSLLIEEGYFETIEVFYLVVGHTHNRLDQWFSVLSKAIRKSNFIGSVEALHNLFRIAHSSKEKHHRPSHVEQIHCYHDWADYFGPVVNEKIKHYQVPHRTRFTNVIGKAVMHYQLFTPDEGWENIWLPIPPADIDLTKIEEESTTIPVTKFMAFDGEEKVYRTLGR